MSHVMPAPFHSRSRSDGEFVPQTFGSNDSSIPCNLYGLASHAPISMVDEKPKYFTPLFSALYDFGDTEVCYVDKTMDVS